MAERLTERFLATVPVFALMMAAVAAAGTERSQIDHIGRNGVRTDLRMGGYTVHRNDVIRLRLRCSDVDTLVVHIECPESGPRALDLSRIRCRRHASAAAEPARRGERRAAVGGSFHPLRRAVVAWKILSRTAGLVTAIIGMIFF